MPEAKPPPFGKGGLKEPVAYELAVFLVRSDAVLRTVMRLRRGAMRSLSHEVRIMPKAHHTRRVHHVPGGNASLTKKTSPLDWSFLWWGRTDSNHRSDTQQIYSLSPLATRELPRMKLVFCLNGAGRRTRTPDLLITNQLLYQLSYTGGSNRTRLL